MPVMTPWAFFRDIRTDAKKHHDIDFRITFGMPEMSCEDLILGVYFHHDGKFVVLQLNERLRSRMQFGWVRPSQFPEVSMLSISDRGANVQQWCIFRPSEQGAQVTIQNMSANASRVPLRHVLTRFYCGEPVVRATVHDPRYLLHLKHHEARQLYSTALCVRSPESQWAEEHFRHTHKIVAAVNIRQEYHTAPDVQRLMELRPPRFWIHDTELREVDGVEAARLGRAKAIAHVFRIDGTEWEPIKQVKI